MLCLLLAYVPFVQSWTPNVNEFVHSSQLFATKCDAAAEDKIWSCGNELEKMGVFSQAGSNQLTVADLKSRSIWRTELTADTTNASIRR